MKKKRKIKKRIKLILLVGIISIGFISTKMVLQAQYDNNERILEEQRILAEQQRIKEENEKKLQYEECLKNSEKNIISEHTNSQITNLEQTLKKYQISLNYYNFDYQFEFNYRENVSYYGASLIKLLDALYLYENAVNGKIDLNSTITYEAKYQAGYSTYMQKKSFGTKVSLKDLVHYALNASDNSAHFMLFDYIGYNNLKNYARSIGLTTVLNRYDKFGEFTSVDAMKLIKYFYQFTSEHELGKNLINSMNNDYYNSLIIDNITTIHKYGLYDYFYHDIGIAYDESPYGIAILSQTGKNNYSTIFKNIHEQVNLINKSFIEDKKAECHRFIYS